MGLQLPHLFLDILLFIAGQRHKIDASAVPVADRFAPREHAILVAAHALIEPDEPRRDFLARFDPHPGNAEVHDFGDMVLPLEMARGDHAQRARAQRGNVVPQDTSGDIVILFYHTIILPENSAFMDTLYQITGWE